jgi:hypothetical protein
MRKGLGQPPGCEEKSRGLRLPIGLVNKLEKSMNMFGFDCRNKFTGMRIGKHTRPVLQQVALSRFKIPNETLIRVTMYKLVS